MYDNDKLGSRQHEIPDEIERLSQDAKAVLEFSAAIAERLKPILSPQDSRQDGPSVAPMLRTTPLAQQLTAIHDIVLATKGFLANIVDHLEI